VATPPNLVTVARHGDWITSLSLVEKLVGMSRIERDHYLTRVSHPVYREV